MNKAFVRETDDWETLCPRCGAAGVVVPESALAKYVTTEIRQRLGNKVFFCETPTCAAVYYDSVEDFIGAEELLLPVYPKDPAAPLCTCFGLVREDIELDLAEGTPRRVREIIAKAKTEAAQCSRTSPSGQSCVAAVKKYYLKRLNKGQP